MKRPLKQLIILLFILLSVCAGCSSKRYVQHERCYSHIEERLATYIAAQDARIGVAVIIDGRDTISVNGNRDFPMLSVYKVSAGDGRGRLLYEKRCRTL